MIYIFLFKCFKNVHWDRVKKHWRGYFVHNGEEIFVGESQDDREVAKAVNEKCHEFGIPLKNPELQIQEDYSKAAMYRKRVKFIIIFFCVTH